jgi:hypothetical protein
MAVEVQERWRLVEDLLERIGESVGHRAQVSAVFGEPVERGSLTVIPVARARFGSAGAAASAPSRVRRARAGVEAAGRLSPRSATSKWAMGAPSSNESQPPWTCSPSSRESRSLHSRSNGCSTSRGATACARAATLGSLTPTASGTLRRKTAILPPVGHTGVGPGRRGPCVRKSRGGHSAAMPGTQAKGKSGTLFAIPRAVERAAGAVVHQAFERLLSSDLPRCWRTF